MKWFNGLGLSDYWGTDGSNDTPDPDNYDGCSGVLAGNAHETNDSGGLYGHNSSLNDFTAEEDPFAEFMIGVRAFDANSHGLFFQDKQSSQQHIVDTDTQIAEDLPEESLLRTPNALGGSSHGHASLGVQADIGLPQVPLHQPIHHPDTAPALLSHQPLRPPQTTLDEQGSQAHDLGGDSRHASGFSSYGEVPTQLSNALTSNDDLVADANATAHSNLPEHDLPISECVPVTYHAPAVAVLEQQPPSTPPPSSRYAQPSLPCVECGTVPSTPRVSKCGHYHCAACVKATKGGGGVSRCGACSDVYKTTKTPEQHARTIKKQASKKSSPIQPEQQSGKSEGVKSAAPENFEDGKTRTKPTAARKAPKSQGILPKEPSPPTLGHLVRLTLHPTALSALALDSPNPSRWAETFHREEPREPEEHEVNDDDASDTQYETPSANTYKRKLAPAVSPKASAPKKPRGTSAIKKRDSVRIQEQAERLSNHNDKLKRQIKNLKDQLETAVVSKQSAEGRSNQRIGKLEREVKDLKSDLKTKKSDFEGSQASQKSLRATITERNTTINSQQAEITSLTQQVVAAEKAEHSKVDELVDKREGSFKGAYERERENVKKIRKLKTEFEDKFKTEKEEREKAEAEIVRLLTVIRDMEHA